MAQNKQNSFDLSQSYFTDQTGTSFTPKLRRQVLINRTLLLLVAFLGLTSVGFGLWLVRERIVGPFRGSLTGDQLQVLVPKLPANDEIEALKAKDSDEDGLNDYQEIYLYNTSPYLTDSDSDDITDSAEIAAGTDPNCPPDQDCHVVRLVTPDTTIADLFPEFSTSTISLKDKTIDDFRQILLAQGYDAAKLSEISDATLLIFLEEVLKEQQQQVATSTVAEPIDYDQVREFLIGLGVPPAEVYSLSNAELANILQTLQ